MENELKPLKVRQQVKTEVKRHVIIVRALHNFGVLTRITSLFAGRGYNIDSLSVGKTNEEGVARITIVVNGDERIIEQIIKQLRKLIETLRVKDITVMPHIERELSLIKVHAGTDSERNEIMRLVNIFRARIVDVYTDTYTIEITGTVEKIEAFIDLIRPFGIKDIARTGVVAITRESTTKKLDFENI